MLGKCDGTERSLPGDGEAAAGRAFPTEGGQRAEGVFPNGGCANSEYTDTDRPNSHQANAHRANERLPLDDLYKATEVIALTLFDLLT